MEKTRVIICERTGKWATAMGRHLPRGIRLLQMRSLGDCAAELAASPTNLVAVEATLRNLSDVLELLWEFSRTYPLAQTVVLADPALRSYEGLLREAGAIHVTHSTRELDGFAGTLRNHLARAILAQTGAAENVWDSLPWGDAATAPASA